MNKTEFQTNSIRETAKSKAFEENYGRVYGLSQSAWPFPTSASMAEKCNQFEDKGHNPTKQAMLPPSSWPFPTPNGSTDEVFYENPRNSVKRFRIEKDLYGKFPMPNDDVDPSYDQTGNKQLMEALNSLPKTITTFKPDRAPMSVLRDTTEGVHFQHTPYINRVKKEVDPNGVDQNSPGAKVDAGKDRVWLCIAGFSRALKEVAKVTTVGAFKYTPNGWTVVPDAENRYMDAFGRHMLDLGTGAKVDDGEGGTNCLHKAQMIWNLLATLELELREKEDGKTTV